MGWVLRQQCGRLLTMATSSSRTAVSCIGELTLLLRIVGSLPAGFPASLQACCLGQASYNPDMTFRVNRNIWFVCFLCSNEFPEGGVAVNLDGESS